MKNKIHERAIVGKNVKIGGNNTISPNVVIEDGVVIGSNNLIGPGVVLLNGTTIGDDNFIHTGVVIGDIPQDLAFKNVESFVNIGNNNRIREYVTIHRGTKENSTTKIGHNNFFMGYTHIAHNCQIGSGVTTVNTAVLGGYVSVGDSAFISASVVVHQFCRIGKLAMVSGLSAVNQDIPPYLICGGRPALVSAVNAVGLKRSGLKPEIRTEIKKAFKLLYFSNLNTSNAISAISKECSSNEIKYFLDFIKSSSRGITSAGSGDDYRF